MAQFIPVNPPNFTPVTRQGGCMCGRFRYEYSGVPVEEVHVLSCNCPICTDKGSLNFYIRPEAFKWLKGAWDALSLYDYFSEYYGHVLHTHFCGSCGSFIGAPGPDFVMLNSRTFDDMDTSRLQLRYFNARGRTAKMDAEEEAARAKEAV